MLDLVRSLRKIPMRLRDTNFSTSSVRFAMSFVKQLNSPECTQIIRNAPKHQFRVQCCGLGAFVQKIPTRLRGTNYCTSSARFASSFVRQPNGPECNKIVRSTAKRQFRFQWGWIGCICYEKFRCNFVARTFALVQPGLHQVS